MRFLEPLRGRSQFDGRSTFVKRNREWEIFLENEQKKIFLEQTGYFSSYVAKEVYQIMIGNCKLYQLSYL